MKLTQIECSETLQTANFEVLKLPIAGLLKGALVLPRKPNNTVHVPAYEHAVCNVYLQPIAHLYFPSLHATSALRSLLHARHAVNICTSNIINT